MSISSEWERFCSHLSEPNSEGCIIWKSTIQPSTGYARFAVVRQIGEKAVSVSAARYLWQKKYGPIHKELTIEHNCHTISSNCSGGITCIHRACVNLDHLSLITRSRNSQLNHLRRDKFNLKDFTNNLGDLSRPGELNGNCKLTDKEVQEIRELYQTGNYYQKELADIFGVAQTQISRIIRKESR